MCLTDDTDIYPMRTGHTLLIPKAHYARLSDLPPEMGAAMGRALPRITKAITEGELCEGTRPGVDPTVW
jgi:diadenosine tetraphosphate (Ap4A) HIT family hydrolase